MSQDLYHAVILEELQSPQNKRVLEAADVTVHETNASCGDDFTIFLKFSPDKKTITEITWQGSGCAISQAAMSLLSEKIMGMRVEEVQKLTQADLEKLLGFAEPIAYGRSKCLLLGLQAVQKALYTP